MALEVAFAEGCCLWLWVFTIFPYKRHWGSFFLVMLFAKHSQEKPPLHETGGSWAGGAELAYIGMADE